MDQILFRGKSLRVLPKEEKWVYGDLIQLQSNTAIHSNTPMREAHNIYPQTVGQYVGIKDKKRVKMFGGDLVMFCGKLHELKWSDKYCGFRLFNHQSSTGLNVYHQSEYEVIGNVHDNTEVLQEVDLSEL